MNYSNFDFQSYFSAYWAGQVMELLQSKCPNFWKHFSRTIRFYLQAFDSKPSTQSDTDAPI